MFEILREYSSQEREEKERGNIYFEFWICYFKLKYIARKNKKQIEIICPNVNALSRAVNIWEYL